MQQVSVTIWNEHVHEQSDARVAAIYPDGIHGVIAVYSQPGHETHPTYHDPNIPRLLANASRWAARRISRDITQALHSPALEPRPGA